MCRIFLVENSTKKCFFFLDSYVHFYEISKESYFWNYFHNKLCMLAYFLKKQNKMDIKIIYL